MLDFQYFLQPGERVLETPSNPISIGVTLQRLSSSSRAAASESGNASMLGSMLFNRCVWPRSEGVGCILHHLKCTCTARTSVERVQCWP
jgi:hypothetical protein